MIAPSPRLVTLGARLSKFLIAVKMYLHSCSSTDCKFLIPCTSICWNTMSLGWVRSISRSVLYPIKKVMKSFTNHPVKCGDDKEKSKPQYEAITRARNLNRRQPAYKGQVLPILSLSPFQAFNLTEHFIPLSSPSIFNAIKDQSWARHPRPIRHDHTLLRAEKYFLTMTIKGTTWFTAGASENT